MERYEYKLVLLEEAKARARADALLVADLGDLPPNNEADRDQVFAHYRRVVHGIISPYERWDAAPTTLIDEMTAAYCTAFKEALEGTWMKGRVRE